MTIYEQEGFSTRRKYLEHLAENFGVSRADVFALADLLGEIEDFDALISTLEDYTS